MNCASEEDYQTARTKELTKKRHNCVTEKSVHGLEITSARLYNDGRSSHRPVDVDIFVNGAKAEHCYNGKWYAGYLDCVDKSNKTCRFVYDIDSSHADDVPFDELRSGIILLDRSCAIEKGQSEKNNRSGD